MVLMEDSYFSKYHEMRSRFFLEFENVEIWSYNFLKQEAKYDAVRSAFQHICDRNEENF